jgi:hypothetical protein
LAQIFSIYLFKNKIIFSFEKFVATKKEGQQIFSPSPLLLLLDPGFKIRDSRSGIDNNMGSGSGIDKNQDPG